ncbi:hypothetical protein TYRP_019280 [Tyrophagus putrescentiae]|nr:hypothetical protein TYRP_019171 [Tyrophagus putrescentiae]KAH9398269.1 hypothetical protein TYRP_019280 [Tyrophagus putrescentiae]
MFSTAVQLCGSIAFDVTGNCTRFAQQQSANATAATTAVSKLTKRPLIASRTLTEPWLSDTAAARLQTGDKID